MEQSFNSQEVQHLPFEEFKQLIDQLRDFIVTNGRYPISLIGDQTEQMLSTLVYQIRTAIFQQQEQESEIPQKQYKTNYIISEQEEEYILEVIPDFRILNNWFNDRVDALAEFIKKNKKSPRVTKVSNPLKDEIWLGVFLKHLKGKHLRPREGYMLTQDQLDYLLYTIPEFRFSGSIKICSHMKLSSECSVCLKLQKFARYQATNVYRIVNAIKYNKQLNITLRLRKYLGIESIEQLKCHLQQQCENIDWSLIGIHYNLDHKIPLWYRKDGIEPDVQELKTRLHYTNLQILYRTDNTAKGNKYISTESQQIDVSVSDLQNRQSKALQSKLKKEQSKQVIKCRGLNLSAFPRPVSQSQ